MKNVDDLVAAKEAYGENLDLFLVKYQILATKEEIEQFSDLLDNIREKDNIKFERILVVLSNNILTQNGALTLYGQLEDNQIQEPSEEFDQAYTDLYHKMVGLEISDCLSSYLNIDEIPSRKIPYVETITMKYEKIDTEEKTNEVVKILKDAYRRKRF